MKVTNPISAFAILLAACAIARAAEKTITVAADGSGDFKTVQDAIAAAPDKAADRTTIHIKPGTYAGHFAVPKSKTNLSLVGDDAATTILTWDRNVKMPIPEGHDKFNPGLHVQGDGFSAEKLTICNTAGDQGQALAVRVDGDRATFTGCRLLGWQDTLMVNNGRQYFKDCYIEGRVDFIYGSGTAVFDHCKIHSKNGGYVTAASTPQDKPWGFVFLDCKLTGDAIPWDPATTNPASTEKPRSTRVASLGRPWRPYAAVAFVRCEMDSHIDPAGWNNWGKAENEQTARYFEFGNTGPGAKRDKRVAWAKELSKDEAGKLTPAAVLGGSDGWNPSRV